MPLRFLFFSVFLWTSFHIIFGMMTTDPNDIFVPGNSEDYDALNRIAFTSLIKMQEVFIVPFDVPIPSPTFLTDIYTLVAFDYPVLEGSFGTYIRAIFLWPMSVATMFFFVTQIAPILISAASVVTFTFVGPIVRFLR